MSVIVMGMEMPENCALCDCSFGALCYVSPAEVNGYCPGHSRPEWCPLRPLPEKHGRLIDGDELADGCDAPHWCRWLSEIEDMPTIVEAEGEDG